MHCDFFWITDGDPEQVIGFLAIRHTLNDFLLEIGGHIGFSVRPARRGEGHASRALALALDRAAELGVEQALVTCDLDNEPSRRTIVRNGGVFEDERKGKKRYWIDTADRGHVRQVAMSASMNSCGSTIEESTTNGSSLRRRNRTRQSRSPGLPTTWIGV